LTTNQSLKSDSDLKVDKEVILLTNELESILLREVCGDGFLKRL